MSNTTYDVVSATNVSLSCSRGEVIVIVGSKQAGCNESAGVARLARLPPTQIRCVPRYELLKNCANRHPNTT